MSDFSVEKAKLSEVKGLESSEKVHKLQNAGQKKHLPQGNYY